MDKILEGIPIYIIAILAVIAFLIFWKILKNIIKAFIVVTIILILFLAILGTLLYFDTKNLQHSFNETKILIIKHNQTILAATKISQKTFLDAITQGLFETVNEEDIKLIQEHYEKNNLNEIYGKDLVIISDYKYIKSDEPIIIMTATLSEKDVKNILNAKNLSEINPFFKEKFENIEILKSKLTAELYLRKFKKLNLYDLAKAIKNKNLEIHPKLYSATIISSIPKSLTNKITFS